MKLHVVHRDGSDRAIADRLSRFGFHTAMTTDVAVPVTAAEPERVFVIDLLSDDGCAVSTVRTGPSAAHPVIGVIDRREPESMARAARMGVTALVDWPFDAADIVAAVCDAREGALGVVDASAAKTDHTVFAESAAMERTLAQVRSAARGDGAVLMTGERATGRKMLTRVLHATGPRPAGPFVIVDAGCSSADMLESWLFGLPSRRSDRIDGDRVSASIARGSALARAAGGTLLIERLEQSADRVQAKLARLVRDGEARIGREMVELDVRLIASVDAAPDCLGPRGPLRPDLLARIVRQRIDVPPLRDRREDIGALATHLIEQASAETASGRRRFSRAALTLLTALPWPGNGLQLRTLVEEIVSVPGPVVVGLDDVLNRVELGTGPFRAYPTGASGTLKDARARFERDWISSALAKHRGHVEEAARALGVQRTNLYRKVRQLHVDRALLRRKD